MIYYLYVKMRLSEYFEKQTKLPYLRETKIVNVSETLSDELLIPDELLKREVF